MTAYRLEEVDFDSYRDIDSEEIESLVPPVVCIESTPRYDLALLMGRTHENEGKACY